MSDDWNRFNSQFEEDPDEKRERWRKTRAKRIAEGKCWQCAQLVAKCTCPNIKHAISHGGTDAGK